LAGIPEISTYIIQGDLKMAMKQPQRSIYKTARGAEIDMIKLINQNEMTVAVGNAKVNARGDKLGPGGKIIKKREELQADQGVPNQINIRPQPEVQAPITSPKTSKKNIENMDPEGNE
jgi:hypothetical protein